MFSRTTSCGSEWGDFTTNSAERETEAQLVRKVPLGSLWFQTCGEDESELGLTPGSTQQEIHFWATRLEPPCPTSLGHPIFHSLGSAEGIMEAGHTYVLSIPGSIPARWDLIPNFPSEGIMSNDPLKESYVKYSQHLLQYHKNVQYPIVLWLLVVSLFGYNTCPPLTESIYLNSWTRPEDERNLSFPPAPILNNNRMLTK